MLRKLIDRLMAGERWRMFGVAFLAGLIGAMIVLLLWLVMGRSGEKVVERVTEKQVYLESSQAIAAVDLVKRNLLTIVTAEDINKISTRSGDFERDCFQQDTGCSKLAVILTSDGLVLSGADLKGRDLSQWVAVDWQKNQYQLLKVGQLKGANLYQLVKKGELLLAPGQRTKFFNLKAVLLADLNLLKSGQKVFGVKSFYVDLLKMAEGGVTSAWSGDGVVKNIDANYSPLMVKFSTGVEGQMLFDLSGALVMLKSLSGEDVFANQIETFLKRYVANVQNFAPVDFGLKCLNIDKKLAAAAGVKVDYGCLVAEGVADDGRLIGNGIAKSSPAEKIGLRNGDLILEVDNVPLLNADLGQILQSKAFGEKLGLEVLRGGKVVKLEMKL